MLAKVESSPKKDGKKASQFESALKKDVEKQFNCSECFYQGTKQVELNKHMNLKHKKGFTNAGTINCRNCDEGFSSKWNLMNHRKSKHLESVAHCRNYKEGKCSYSDDMCWWNHDKEVETNFKWYFCNEIFESKSNLMIHRKKEHERSVKPCSQFQQNNCRFNDSSCWFQHDDVSCTNESKEDKFEQVFKGFPKTRSPL